MSMQRLLAESEEADNFLSSLNDGQGAPADQSPAPSTGEPQAPPAGIQPPPVVTTPAPTPSTDTVAALSAEVAQLRAQLTGDNNPTWKQKFMTLQGKYEAEVPRLLDEIKGLKEKITVAPDPRLKEVLKEVQDEFGERTAKNFQALVESENQELRDKVKQLEDTLQSFAAKQDNLQKVTAQTAEDRFFSDLERNVPDWKQLHGWDNIAQDPRFTNFLYQKPNELSDNTYGELLNRFSQTLDVGKVAKIFDIFKQSIGTPAPTTPATPAPAPTPPKAAGIEQYIEPNKTGQGSPAPNQQPDKKIYSQAEMDRFFDLRIKKPDSLRMTPQEIANMEKEYTQAILEGRVR